MELEYSKKIESRCSSKKETITEEKVNVVSELRLKYPLMILLKVSGLAKSVYYYTLSKINKENKNKEIITNKGDHLQSTKNRCEFKLCMVNICVGRKYAYL